MLEGDLTEALELLSALGIDDSGANKEARFLILEQVFLEVCRLARRRLVAQNVVWPLTGIGLATGDSAIKYDKGARMNSLKINIQLLQ